MARSYEHENVVRHRITVPLELYKTSRSHVERANTNFPYYLHIGLTLFNQLALTGGLQTGSTLSMHGHKRAIGNVITPLDKPVNKSTEVRVAVRRSVSEEMTEIATARHKTIDEYAIVSLSFLNGLVKIRNDINRSLPLAFEVLPESDRRAQLPPTPFIFNKL